MKRNRERITEADQPIDPRPALRLVTLQDDLYCEKSNFAILRTSPGQILCIGRIKPDTFGNPPNWPDPDGEPFTFDIMPLTDELKAWCKEQDLPYVDL